nr:hypothetical protein [Tanacetum cinerariifolium]
MANPLLNHSVNLLDDEQVQPEPIPALLGFAPAVLDIPNNNNGWIEEKPEEDPKMEEEEKEEEEEEEMDIEDEMDDPEIIDPYEIEECELPPPPANSDTSSDSEPEVESEDEEEDEADTVGTITHAPYSVQTFSGTTYVGSGSSRKVFGPGPIGKDVDILHRKVKGLAQQMFERANAEYSTLKRLGEMDRYLGGISRRGGVKLESIISSSRAVVRLEITCTYGEITTAPMAKSLASHISSNSRSQFGVIKIGASQNQRDVNDVMGLEKKTVVVTSDPLALIAEKMKVSKRKEKVVVSLDSEGSDADDFSELKKITALLAKAFNLKKFNSKQPNNNLRTSSASQSANKKQEYVKSDDKKFEKKDDEKKRDIRKVKCYNCKKEGNFAKDCKKVKVKDCEYYKT